MTAFLLGGEEQEFYLGCSILFREKSFYFSMEVVCAYVKLKLLINDASHVWGGNLLKFFVLIYLNKFINPLFHS